MKGMLGERAVAGDEGGVIRQWQREQGEEAKDAGMEVRTSTRCVREDIRQRASSSLSLSDLFYPPSAC